MHQHLIGSIFYASVSVMYVCLYVKSRGCNVQKTAVNHSSNSLAYNVSLSLAYRNDFCSHWLDFPNVR